MIAVDTNVLVYMVDAGDIAKRDTATGLVQKIHGDGNGVLLWQVAVEFLAVLRKRTRDNRLTEAEALVYFNYICQLLPLKLPTAQVLLHAMALFNEFSLSHWDSMLLGGCLDAGVTTLYTEDLSSGVLYESVLATNPFISPPQNELQP